MSIWIFIWKGCYVSPCPINEGISAVRANVNDIDAHTDLAETVPTDRDKRNSSDTIESTENK